MHYVFIIQLSFTSSIIMERSINKFNSSRIISLLSCHVLQSIIVDEQNKFAFLPCLRAIFIGIADLIHQTVMEQSER
jgi:hypothetical protein